MGYCLDLPHGWQIFGDWLYNWQTLIAGIIAIFAAMIGASAVYCQTQKSQQLEQAELNRRHRAEKAILPLVLSDIILSCRSSLLFEAPFSLPPTSAERLYEFSKTTEDDGLAQLVHEVCKRIQIRLARQSEKVIVAYEEPLYIAEISALTERILLYCSDGKASPYDVDWSQVLNVLHIAGLRKDSSPTVFDRWQQSKDAHEFCWRPSHDR